MGTTNGLTFLQQVASHGPTLFPSNSSTGDALSRGQVSIAIAVQLADVLPNQKSGAPVDYVVPDVVFVQVGAISVTKSAPHPYAAAPFVDYILSQAGQTIVSMNNNPTRDGFTFHRLPVLASAKKVVLFSPGLVGQDYSAAQALFEQRFVR